MGIGQWRGHIFRTRFETSGIISNYSGWWCSAYAAWRIGAKIRVMQARSKPSGPDPKAKGSPHTRYKTKMEK